MENLESSVYGSVRPYTRHGAKCSHAKEPDYNSCRCPKWLYSWNKKTGVKSRTSLVTHSWAEARRIASDTLRGMDPEIAAGREAEEKQNTQRMTVADACDLWIDRSRRLLGDEASTINQYRTLKKSLCAWAHARGITHIQDITTLQLEQWYSSRAWSHLAPTTASQRWGCVRSMFAFWADRSIIDKSPAAPIQRAKAEVAHVQGPYTDAQVKRILDSIDNSIPFNLPLAKRPTYAHRLRVFIKLLLHAGLDVSDAILHEPSRLETHKVGKRKVPVYRYRRIKTDVEAVIPIPPEIADEIKSVPLEPGTSTEMPFRTPGLKLKLNQKLWSNRINAVLDAAGVEHVELPGRDTNGRPMRKEANSKMFRHTFAVRQLKTGQRAEEVAKMLGHVDTEMVRKHYAPWVKDLDDAHIKRVVSGWGK